MKLNLGCGNKKLHGFVNVDSQPLENPDVVADLGAAAWPWADNSVDYAIASHLLEHLPGETFFHFLRELYRVCKPGAKVDVALPHPRHDVFLQDPTHVRAVLPGTLAMFSRDYCEMMGAKGVHLTPFWKYNSVDFRIDSVHYRFENDVDTTDPEFAWKMKHLSNFVLEWTATLTVVKGSA